MAAFFLCELDEDIDEEGLDMQKPRLSGTTEKLCARLAQITDPAKVTIDDIIMIRATITYLRTQQALITAQPLTAESLAAAITGLINPQMPPEQVAATITSLISLN